MSESKQKLPGHKCRGVRVAYHASCECGWVSIWIYGGKFGAGGRAGAYAEWRAHVEKCQHPAPVQAHTEGEGE